MSARRRWVAAVMMTVLAVAGCSSAVPREAAPAAVETPSPTPTPTPTPEPTPEPTWPLTGLPLGEAAGDGPALAVKVENTAMARPQTGLEDADVVWEEMVEGGITRFNAVFHSRLPEVVGPIRSLRPMDAGIVAPLDGPQVISGGQPLFLASVQAEGVQLISNDSGHAGFFRSSERRAPHNLYGRPADFLLQSLTTDPPPEQFLFAEDAAEASAVTGGQAATALHLRFPQTAPSWTWDAAAQRWLRDEAGTPSVSAAGEVLGAENVVVLRVQVIASAGRDQAGSAVPETVMTGGGQALVASGGRTLEATWSKDTTSERVTLRTADGADVTLVPGTTWVELVPVDRGGVEITR